MNKLIVILVALVFYSNSFCQKYYQEQLSLKLKRSIEMKNTGKKLLAGGVISYAVAVGFWIKVMDEQNKATDEFNQKEYHTQDDFDAVHEAGTGPAAVSGICIAGGTVLVITGITLWKIGGNKSKQYKKLLEKYEKKLSLTINKRGIGLQLNF